MPLELQAHPPPWWTDRGPDPIRAVPLRGGSVMATRRRCLTPPEAPWPVPWMPKVGLEPTRPRGQRILSPPRLPVPPLRPATRMVEAPWSDGWERFSHDGAARLV